MKPIILCWLFLACHSYGNAQVTDKSGQCRFTLGDDTEVILIPGFEAEGTHTYYYLPYNLQLSIRQDKTPEFSLLTYNNDKGELEGSILTFLILWGLLPEEEKELQQQLLKTDSTGIIAGPVALELPPGEASVKILGDSEFANLLRARLNYVPVAPVIPGTKLAFSYRFNAAETKTVQDALANAKVLDNTHIELAYILRAGNAQNALNRIDGEKYFLKSSLRNLFEPVLPSQRKNK